MAELVQRYLDQILDPDGVLDAAQHAYARVFGTLDEALNAASGRRAGSDG